MWFVEFVESAIEATAHEKRPRIRIGRAAARFAVLVAIDPDWLPLARPAYRFE